MANGTSLGKASLTEMESDLCAVDGLRSSVLVKLQELSIGARRKHLSERFEFRSFSIAPFRRKQELDKALKLIRDSLRSASMKAQSSFWSEDARPQ